MNDIRTEAQFRHAVISRYIPALLKLSAHKGEQYIGDQKPALENFYEGSKITGDSPAHYLMSLATKQWYTIINWSMLANVKSVAKREIVQRLFDIIIYLFLLLFMIENDGEVELSGDAQ